EEKAEEEKPAKPEKEEKAEEEKPAKPEKEEKAEEEKPAKPEKEEKAEEEKPAKPEKEEEAEAEKPAPPAPAEEVKFNADVIKLIQDFVSNISSLLPDFTEFEGFEVSEDFGVKDLRAVFRHIKDAGRKPEAPKAPEAPKHPLGEFTGLKKFEVSEDNKELAGEDGVLLDKEKKVLIAYPAGKEDEEFKVPEGVEEIGPHAFENNKHLKKIELPDTVKKIGKGAFENCENLEEVKLPEDVKVIEEDTFKGDEKLEKINKPEKLEVIKDDAFKGVEKLDEKVKEELKKHEDLKYGDLTKDKKIDVTDLSTLALHLVGDKDLDNDQKVVANVREDEGVNLADLATLKRKVAGHKEHLGPDAAKDVLGLDEEEEEAEEAAE
ncbi:MAG: leucine-rich repeat protein, partial [Oscillospiraceae bacterium]|nr:leucine-rich repeat protein [Oscillospiraceae bacterium]